MNSKTMNSKKTNSKKIPVIKQCPFCYHSTVMYINAETEEAYIHYLVKDGSCNYIQDIPVDDRKSDKGKRIVREFLKSGYCRECQKMLFG